MFCVYFSALENDQAFILLPDAAVLILFSDIFRRRHDDGDDRGFGGAKLWWGNE